MQSTIKQQKKYYDSIKSVYCTCLDTDIVVNAKGFHHLFYEGGGTPRSKTEIQYRLKLVPLIVPTIKQAKEYTYQERMAKTSRKKNASIKLIKYWALIAWVGQSNNIKIKVIVRQVGNGKIHFWSIMKLADKNKRHQPNG